LIFFFKERINVSLSINDKIDDNIRQIKRKLVLYESDLNRLKTEIPSTVSDKRIRAELAVVCFLIFFKNKISIVFI
jgi:hypothetical protein